jgi:hypothetical protein
MTADASRPLMRPILEVCDEVGEPQLLTQLKERHRPADRRDSHDYGKFHEIDHRLWYDDRAAKEVMRWGTLAAWDSKIVPTTMLPFSGVVACPVFVGPVQASSQPIKRGGGRRTEHDWEGAAHHLSKYFYDYGFPPLDEEEFKATVAKVIRDFFTNNYPGHGPDQSGISRHVDLIWKKFMQN